MTGLYNLTNGFIPERFVADETLRSLHKSTAFRFTNEIQMPKDNVDNWQDYWYGLIIVPCVFVFLLIVWGLVICYGNCCKCAYREQPKNRMCGFVTFVLIGIGAVIVWCLVFAVNESIGDGTAELFGAIEILTNYVADWFDFLFEIRLDLVAIKLRMTHTVGNCSDPKYADIVNLIQPQLEPESVINQAIRTLDSFLAEIPGIEDTLQDVHDGANSFDDARSVVIITFGVIMLCLTLFFLFATSIQFLDLGSEACRGFKTCLSRSSCITIFTFGLLLVAISVLIGAILQPLSVAGSDTCAPGPDYTLQRLISQINNEPMLIIQDSQRFGGGKVCVEPENSTGVSDFTKLICFYQVCDDTFTDIQIALNYILQLNDLFTNSGVNTTGIPKDACVNNFDELTLGLLDKFTRIVVGIIDQFGCGRINPIYQQFFHQGFCNGIITATGDAWKFFISGSILMLCMLFLHSHYHLHYRKDFRFKRERKKLEQEYIETSHNDFDADQQEENEDAGIGLLAHKKNDDSPKVAQSVELPKVLPSDSYQNNEIQTARPLDPNEIGLA